jgi:hypothetical protein
MSYIASNDNRLYAGLEITPGTVPAITAANRFPAVRLGVRQKLHAPVRKDKTGTRTFHGHPAGLRRETLYTLKTYLTSWLDTNVQPAYAPLFQAALGGTSQIWAGGTIISADGTTIVFAAAHGLTPGQAVACGGEIRFVTAVVSESTVEVNAPFVGDVANAVAIPTITWRASRSLPTVSLFDYWSPEGALQRIVSGAAVDEFRIAVNADYHEFEFRGPARDVIDSASFANGQGQLSEFPEEPAVQTWDPAIIPGHLGQVWMGAVAERMYTLTSADIRLHNNVEARSREFGLDGMRAVTAGQREVSINFDLYAGSDESTNSLYAAARQRSPMQVMFQLGERSQQLFGVYLKSVVPEMPEFDDSETRLSWKFRECRAQGSADDEIIVALA